MDENLAKAFISPCNDTPFKPYHLREPESVFDHGYSVIRKKAGDRYVYTVLYEGHFIGLVATEHPTANFTCWAINYEISKHYRRQHFAASEPEE